MSGVANGRRPCEGRLVTGDAPGHTVRLAVDGPYDLSRARAFLAGWPPATSTAARGDGARAFLAGWPPATSTAAREDGAREDGALDDGALAMAYVLDDGSRSIGVTLRQDGPAALDATFPEPATPPLVGQLRRILGLDLDGPGFARLAERDPALTALQARAPGVRPVLFPSPYDAAAWAVLSARTPALRAAAHRRALCEQLGTTHAMDGQRLAAFPTPQQLRALDALPGLPAEKVRRLHAVADAADDGRLDVAALAALPSDAALARLKTVRGIGDFYAQLVLVRALPGADLMPTGEPRLLAAAARLFGEPELSADRLGALTLPWSPHRAWAAFLLRTS